MKLENKKLNSFFENNEHCFQLWINLVDKSVEWTATMTGRDSITFEFSDESECKLIAENEGDQEILDRFYFELRDKWQIWLIFPSNGVLSLDKRCFINKFTVMKHTSGRSKLNSNQQNVIDCIERARELMRLIGNPQFDQKWAVEQVVTCLNLYCHYRESTYRGLPNGRVLRHKIPVRCKSWVENKLMKLENIS